MLSTPYYRTLTINHALGCDDLPTSNYVSYDIFCLETRLYPTVYKLLNRNVQLVFKTINMNNRMELKIFLESSDSSNTNKLSNTNEISDISNEIIKQLQSETDKILSTYIGYSVIDCNELLISSRVRYPSGWFHSILRYLNISSEYQPFYKDNGIYLAFNPYSDYITAYNKISQTILKTIEEYYRDGVVFGAEKITEKWYLERLDVSEVVGKLFKPLWKDKRIAPYPVEFLLDRIKEIPDIRIDISKNLVKRHNIASRLSLLGVSLIFEENCVRITVDNLDDAQYYTAVIHSIENTTVGRVVTESFGSMDQVKLYVNVAIKLFSNANVVGYQTSNIDKPYVFSYLIPSNSLEQGVLEKIKEVIYDDSLNKKD